MKTNRLIRDAGIFLLLLANIGCDQVSKELVRKRVDMYENISLFKGYLILTKVENTGAFLSVGSALPDALKFILLSILPLFALSFGIVYLVTRKHLSTLSSMALSFAIGGGIGNIYDRIIHGSVTDFLHIDLGFVRTGIFNLADVSIMIGMCIFIYQSLVLKK